MLVIFLLGLMVYFNVRLAKTKGQNPLLWGILSVVAFFIFYALLGSIYIAIIYKGPVTREALEAYLLREPMVAAMLAAIGVGGVLFVRFVLERKRPPGGNSPKE